MLDFLSTLTGTGPVTFSFAGTGANGNIIFNGGDGYIVNNSGGGNNNNDIGITARNVILDARTEAYVRNGGAPANSAFRVYAVGTPGVADYERGTFDWVSTANTLTIGTQNSGTGLARSVKLISGVDLTIVAGAAGTLSYFQSATQRMLLTGANFQLFGGGFTSTLTSAALFLGSQTSADPQIVRAGVALRICRGDSAVATFSQLPAAAAGNEGSICAITDSNTNVWGAVAAGGGANHVMVYSNGTAWTVMAK